MLYPEHLWQVIITESAVRCTAANGEAVEISFDELRTVWIETTDEGPMTADVFWILEGGEGGVLKRMRIPQGATGEKELLPRLQQLPNFDNEAVIKSMMSTDNALFLCWKKSEA